MNNKIYAPNINYKHAIKLIFLGVKICWVCIPDFSENIETITNNINKYRKCSIMINRSER